MHRSSQPRLLRYTVLALLVVLAGLLALTGAGVRPGAGEPAADAAMSAGPGPQGFDAGAPRRDAIPAAHGEGVWSAPPGTVLRFALTDRNEYGVLDKDGQQVQASGIRTTGTLCTRVLARRGDEIVVDHAIDAVAFQGLLGETVPADALHGKLLAAARTTVVARLATDGRVLGYRFAAGLDGDQRNFLRGLLAACAFTVPAGAGERWVATESDTTGVYEAGYRRVSNEGGRLVVRRTKTAYTATAGDPPRELRGDAEATFTTAPGWLAAAKLDESLVADLSLLAMRLQWGHRVTLVLESTAHEAVPLDEDALWQGAWDATAGHAERLGDHAATAAEERWRKQLAGVDLAQLLDTLRALLAAEQPDAAELDALFQQLQWLVRLDPANAAAIARLVAEGSLTGSAASVAVTSLAAAGSAAAQQAIVAIRAEPGVAAEVREAATVGLLQVAQPEPALLQSLLTDAFADRPDRAGSLLVLGALAPRCGEALGDGRTALQSLLAMEDDAARRGDLPTWLRALGNAGTEDTLAAAGRYLGHTDAMVRAAAYGALRRVANPVALRLLERGLLDTAAEVRGEVALALGDRTEDSARLTLRNLAVADQDPQVRRAALDGLCRDLKDPGNRAVLQRVAARDADPWLRELAARLLQGA